LLSATLADTGPIVAFLNARDRHHRWAVETMAQLRPPLLTCESVLSEAAFRAETPGACVVAGLWRLRPLGA
jgi:hypothetical protein